LVVSWRWGPPRLDAGAAVHSVLVAAYVQDLLPAEGDPLDLSDDELDLPPVEFLFGLVEVIGLFEVERGGSVCGVVSGVFACG